MNHLRLVSTLLLFFPLTFGCAASQDRVKGRIGPAEKWVGQLNARDARHHPGTYLLTLVTTPKGLVGEYTLESDVCLAQGQVEGTRQSADLQAVVKQGDSIIEIRASIVGESFFGTYRFTSGPCRGDWGSTMAQRTLTPSN